MLSFLHLCCLWSMLHTHTRQLGIPLSLGLSVFFLHCPFQMEIIFVNRVVAIASLLLISGVLFPFASILAPRYSKLRTLSISSPSIAILASFLHLSMPIIFVFFILRNIPFSSLCSLTDFISFSRPVGVVDSSAVSSAYLRSFRWTPWIEGSS